MSSDDGPDGPWVIPEPGWVCPECGFDFDACDPQETPTLIRAFPPRYRIPLERALPGEDLDTIVRARPSPTTWSALEYACHARDSFWLYDERVTTTMKEDRPSFPRMRRDALVVERDYNHEDPAAVLTGLEGATRALAVELEYVKDDAWTRRAYRDDLEMTVAWMARNAVHEGQHHLLDIGRALRAARAGRPRGGTRPVA
jgi:hypothetical protein